MLRDIDMRSYITKKAPIKSSTFFPASLSAIDIIRRKAACHLGLVLCSFGIPPSVLPICLPTSKYVVPRGSALEHLYEDREEMNHSSLWFVV